MNVTFYYTIVTKYNWGILGLKTILEALRKIRKLSVPLCKLMKEQGRRENQI